jgi:transcriptional pleiotropic repressor
VNEKVEHSELKHSEFDGVLEDFLDKTRRVRSALRSRQELEMAGLLFKSPTTNIYVLDSDGKGRAWDWALRCARTEEWGPCGLSGAILTKLERYCEMEADNDDICLLDGFDEKGRETYLMCIPFFNLAAERLSTVMLVRFELSFGMADIFWAEYLRTFADAWALFDRNWDVEYKLRDRSVVQAALRALSHSEAESIKHVMADLGGYEGVVFSYKIADRVGVARSIIVNALNKLESAGLIKRRSMGMKGTYIKVLNPFFVEELGGAKLWKAS